MRQIAQPGPALAPRILSASGTGRAFRCTLQPGQPLLHAATQAFAHEGFTSGVLRLRGGGFGPFAYVMPALPVSPRNAAYYSATHRPPGLTRLAQGAMTLGQRDGAAFFHCHALWTEADGRPSGGHILPEECTIAQPIEVEAVGLHHAGFEAQEDPETNFRLFQPRGGSGAGRFHALRLRPNQELHLALQAFCRAHGIDQAILHGGVGSLIGAHYASGQRIEPFATEMFLTSGVIHAAGQGSAIHIGMMDHSGTTSTGLLTPGENPVLMTMELVLEAV